MPGANSIELIAQRAAGGAALAHRRLANVLFVVAAVLAVVALVVVVASLSTPAPEAGYLRGSVAVFGLAWAAVGNRIAARFPANPVGWLMLATGVGFGLIAVTQELAIAAIAGGPAVSLDAVIRSVRAGTFLTTLAAGLTLLLFPDGRLPSRVWLLVAVGLVLTSALGTGVALSGPLNLAPGTTQPFSAAEAAFLQLPLYSVARYGAPLFLVLCAVGLVARLIRARGRQRKQLKWVVTGATFAVVMNLIANVLPFVDLVQIVQIASLLAFPVTVGIAMTRYELYDIDYILNRTLVYILLSGFLAGLTAAVSGGIQAAFVAATGQRSDAAILITTLVIVAVFAPAREVAQRYVDTHAGRRPRGLSGLEGFATEMRQFADLSTSQRLLLRLLKESVAAFESEGGAVELRRPDGTVSIQEVGEWSGDSHVTLNISAGNDVDATLRLGARADNEPYSRRDLERLRSAADAVVYALDA